MRKILWRKVSPYTLLVGMQAGPGTMKVNKKGSQKILKRDLSYNQTISFLDID